MQGWIENRAIGCARYSPCIREIGTTALPEVSTFIELPYVDASAKAKTEPVVGRSFQAKDRAKLAKVFIRRSGLVLSLWFALLVLMTAPAELEANATQVSAQWETKIKVVHLRYLPHRYSCVALERVIRDVLVQLGVRAVRVTARRCESALGSMARSPVVRMKYSELIEAQKARAKTAVRAASKIVRLAPENPPSLTAEDCKLLRQLRTVLPGEPQGFRLACGVPPSITPRYYFDVKVLAPIPVSPGSRKRIASTRGSSGK